MKHFILICAVLLFGTSIFLLADNESREGYGGSPVSILDTVVGKANKDYKIQDTKMDRATSAHVNYSWNSKYRITNTLAYFKDNIHPYLQRGVYIGLTVATILFIYNGFLLVTASVHDSGEFSKIKTNLIYIGIGVIILTGFYFLIDLVVAIMNYLFT